MLSEEEKFIAERLKNICDVPLKFIELVIESETILDDTSIDEKIRKYKERIVFLNKITHIESSNTNPTIEFLAQCLAATTDLPIDLAKMVLYAESDENLNEEDEMRIRTDRINFLLKVFSFIQNNPRFHI